ncbi:hypothetical protein [Streptomyces sp. BPTC-684]|uniref:hypothetical protein n=1 Tax=Streptomyces sp. BPTC-684 TaxID=3043734 RepID=UPI0024B11994|nr:hypothetical protein [Streptomyces sp. BPTC-684]WHM38867.1 hypothetical protein QIY60_19515 [Streptomyces sp. BPTC-684]
MRGKAVVVRAAAGVTRRQQAAAAQRAGVAALFVTDDAPGRLSEWFGTDEGAAAPLAVASVNAADAARLREVPAGGTAVWWAPATPRTSTTSPKAIRAPSRTAI